MRTLGPFRLHSHGVTWKRQHSPPSDNRNRLIVALGIVGALAAIEATAGFFTNSLALLADAGHLLSDVGAIGLSLLAMWFASRPISQDRSYGYHRAEMLASLLNGLALWAVAAYISFSAYGRLTDPPAVDSLPMVLVASGGFVAQTFTAIIIRHGTGSNLNVKAAYIHVMTDAVQSVGVVLAGILMLAFGWFLADPIISFFIAILVTWSGGKIIWEAAEILMETSPRHVDANALCTRLEGVEGVTGIHDIHTWSITTGYEMLSAHVTVDLDVVKDPGRLLHHLRGIASEEFGIAHTTIQIESARFKCSENHHVDHSNITATSRAR
jgi:cobalt-zinc-cadmium efflux system protein